MIYIIRRSSDNKIVARPGMEHSYTNNIDDAAIYSSRDAAEKQACGNEYVQGLQATQR